MVIVKNRVIHVKQLLQNNECNQHTLYEGDIVPKGIEELFFEQGGEAKKEEVKESIPIKEDKKEEVKDINDMDKDELEEYARENFKVDLDKRSSLWKLRREVKKLMDS